MAILNMVLECEGGGSSLESCGGCGTAGVVLAALSVRCPSVPPTTATPEEMLGGRGDEVNVFLVYNIL